MTPSFRGCTELQHDGAAVATASAVGMASHPLHKSTQHRDTKRHTLGSFFIIFRQCQYFG